MGFDLQNTVPAQPLAPTDGNREVLVLISSTQQSAPPTQGPHRFRQSAPPTQGPHSTQLLALSTQGPHSTRQSALPVVCCPNVPVPRPRYHPQMVGRPRCGLGGTGPPSPTADSLGRVLLTCGSEYTSSHSAQYFTGHPHNMARR